MALTVKIDGLDISEYVQASLDSFDPANAFQEPQFAGNSLTDGDLFVSMTRNNREWPIPLLIVATSNDNLASTVQQINNHLKQGVTLEYREDGATNSTYFDVESATLEPDYRYQRNRQGVGKFLLKVWTRPLGHTGTTRIVATGAATPYFAYPVASMSITGDADARLRLVATQPLATTAAQSRLFGAWGYTPFASYNGVLRAGIEMGMATTAFTAGSLIADNVSRFATVMGWPSAGGMAIMSSAGDQYKLASSFLGQNLRLFMSARVLARAASGASYCVYAQTQLTDGVTTKSGPVVRVGGATSTIDSTASHYALYDLGAISTPTDPHATVVSCWVDLRATNMATVLASQPIRMEALYAVPINHSGYTVGTRTSNPARIVEVNGVAGHYRDRHSGEGEMRGEFPSVPPTATGLLVGLLTSMGLSQASARDAFSFNYEIGAREQFQFFR